MSDGARRSGLGLGSERRAVCGIGFLSCEAIGSDRVHTSCLIHVRGDLAP
jgi:hypothetical protein